MTVAMATAGIAIWCLVALAVVIALAGAWVMTHPDSITKGQDAAGKGMLAGCFGFMLFVVVAILGIVAAVLAVRGRAELGWPTLVVAWLPIFGLTVAILTGYIVSQVARAKDEEAREAEIRKIPVFLLVDADDYKGLSPMFNALQGHYPHVQQQLFKSPVALHWQQHWLPRAKIIAIQADRMVEGKDISAETAELIEDINFMNPGVDVLLHAADPRDAEPFLAELKHAKVIQSGEGWIEQRWLPAALEILAKYPELKEKQKDQMDYI
jgi:hypothetical protein